MAIPKSTQRRFLGIRDNHNHYTYIPMLAFLDYNNYRPIDVDLFKACYPWSVLDFHVGEILVYQARPFFARRPLPTPSTREKGLAMVSVGMQFIW